MTRAEFDARLQRLDQPDESWWTAIRERSDTTIMIAVPVIVSGATWGVVRLGWIRSYTDLLLGFGIAIVGVTLLGLASWARDIGAHSRRARRLGLSCGGCQELLVLPYETTDVDPVAAGVRQTGRCPGCAARVIDTQSDSPVSAPAG